MAEPLALSREDAVPHSLATDLFALGAEARAAARELAVASTDAKNRALLIAADAIENSVGAILAANAADMAAARAAHATPAFLDRLSVDEARIKSMIASLHDIAELPDPVGTELARWQRPNGLDIARVRTPLGVIGVIFESRPNVTVDAGALCLKAGNAAILRCGSDSLSTSTALHSCLVAGLAGAGLPEAAIHLVPSRDRAAVGLMLSGLGGAIDVIVPRGGKSLVARVQAEARVPVFAHLEGNCHVYVHEAADLAMAKAIVLNAKLRRTGVCGSAETLLLDEAVADTHLARLVTMLLDAGCEVRGCEATLAVDARVKPATDADWATEYLDAIIAVKVVDDIDAAIAHIAQYGSSHTEAIITDDAAAAEMFLARVDSAIVLHNASTQFADGGEFGMGAEIGIATGRMHARGPVGVEQLTSFKYVVRGTGQIRPK